MTSIAVYYAHRARHQTVLQPTSHLGENTDPPASASALAAVEAEQIVRAYRRDLPGSGFVAIDVHATRSGWWRPRRFEGEVIVERRSVWRAGRHTSPVIARATGDTVEEVVRLLLPAARCNETIGAALLRLHPVVRTGSTS